MYRQRVKYSLILISLFMATQTFAASVNDLVGVDVNQTSENSVKINIYTEKPYKDEIIVNKKPNNQYVILLPETSTSVYSNPDVSGIPALNRIEVKAQQYSSLPDKGYTKITIDSKRPIEVVPQAIVSKKVQSTTANKTSYAPKTVNKSYTANQQVPMALPQRVLNQQKPVSNSDFTSNTERKSPQDYAAPTSQQISRQRNENISQRIQQNRNNTISEVLTLPPNLESQSTVPPDETPSAEQTQQQVEDEKQEQTQEAEEKTTSSNVEDDISEDDLAFFKKLIRFKQKVVRKIKQILSIRISFNSFATILQLILLGVLIKLVADFIAKLNKDEAPLKTRLIHNEEEHFEPSYPTYSDMDVYNTSRSNFEEDNKEGFNIQPVSTSYIEKSNSFNDYKNPYLAKNNNSFNLIDEVHDMSVFDENSKDIEKAIFKNPLTPISKEDEEKLFDEDVEPSQENSPFIYEQDEQDEFSEIADEIANENDFVIYEDENASDENLYSNNYDNIEEVAMDDEYDLDAELEDSEVEDVQIEEENENEDDEEYIYVDENGDEYEEINEDEYEEIAENETQTEDLSESQQKEEVNPFDHLKVESKYVIDSFRGFAHVNVDGVNAIISYVGSNVNIIRKFKENIDGKMQVRINEQPDEETLIYIVKLGNYKTLVEVKPNSIRPLLDL